MTWTDAADAAPNAGDDVITDVTFGAQHVRSTGCNCRRFFNDVTLAFDATSSRTIIRNSHNNHPNQLLIRTVTALDDINNPYNVRRYERGDTSV